MSHKISDNLCHTYLTLCQYQPNHYLSLLYLGCQGTENFEIQIAVKGFLNIKDSNNAMIIDYIFTHKMLK